MFETTLSVRPSGAERAKACSPTMPPAPAWFSTTTGMFSALASAACAVRVIVSTPEPVALGRMNLTTLSAWAMALPASANVAAARIKVRRAGIESLMGSIWVSV